MVWVRNNKTGKTRRVGFRKRKFSRKTGVSQKIKKYVKKTIHSQIENKTYHANTPYIDISTPSGATVTSLNVMPSISQGATKATRTGNQIKLVKHTVRGQVYLKPYDATNNPRPGSTVCKIWLMSMKKSHSSTLTLGSDFFDNGASNEGFGGNINDCLMPVNKDSYKIHATRSFELGTGSNLGSANGATSGYFDQKNSIMNFQFNLAKYSKKNIKFDDTGSTPTNENMFLIFACYFGNGDTPTTAPVGNTKLAKYNVLVRAEYEDA